MNREQFLEELAGLLSDISASEREEALQYYRDYFEDANLSDEEVIRQLGSAKTVAESIRAELADKEIALYQPQKDDQEKTTEKEDIISSVEEKQSENQGQSKSGMSTGTIVLIVILALLASPVIVSIAGGLIGLLVGVAAAIFGILVAVVACAVAFGAAAIALFVAGLVKLFLSPVAALLLLGSCMLCLGLCLLCALATVQLCIHVLPGIFKGIGRLFSKLFQGKEKVRI
ncbi:MAG: DUF1700 domain-containing protein [Lachnospiraceae bacterium]|nr:DUF1700 domain-containing protein [Lachnospiraceae bacterium]